MLDDTDRAVLGWAAEVSGIPNPSLSLPTPTSEGPHVNLYLFDVEDLPPMRGNGRVPLQFTARYLVTVTAPDAEEAHRILGELVFAAMESPDYDITLGPIDAGYWQALNVPPLPAFLLKVPVRRERPTTPAPLVRQALRVDSAPLKVLEGVVTAPDGIPLPGVRVELTMNGSAGSIARTSTDTAGRFEMTVGPLSEDQHLRFSAKNHTMTATLAEATDTEGIVRVQFDPSDQ